jgi:hypothetical protein
MTTTMPKHRSLLIRRLASIAGTLAAVFLAFAGTPARADVLGECSSITLITCAASDVGKPCQGGGSCMAVPCAKGQLGANPSMVYKCEACPTVIPVPSGTCTLGQMGTACGGDGGAGTCEIVSSECQTSTNADKVSCIIPAAQPTGPPAGEGSSSSGCDLAPIRPAEGKESTRPTALGLGLVVVGIAAFFIDRARRRHR